MNPKPKEKNQPNGRQRIVEGKKLVQVFIFTTYRLAIKIKREITIRREFQILDLLNPQVSSCLPKI